MEKYEFVQGRWWISATDCNERVVMSRKALGAAFGWSDESWPTQEDNLAAVYDLVQDDSTLITQIKDALTDELREQWLNAVIALKEFVPPEEPDDVEPTASETVPEEPPEEQATPVRKPLFGPKPELVPTEAAQPLLPSIAGLPAGLKKLLAGTMEKATVDEAVMQIYDNLHHNTGWVYKSVGTSDPAGLLSGARTNGMCESFRNAFLKAVEKYDALRRNHPVEAVKTAPLAWERDDTLNASNFCTREGLSLIGTGLKGNVDLEINAKGAITARGYDSCNKFVFGKHWSAKVNSRVYDPIFYSIDEDNIAFNLDRSYQGNGGRFVVEIRPTPAQEFSGSRTWISDWTAFSTTVADMKALYNQYQKDIDKILAGTMSIQEGLVQKTDRKCYTRAKALVAERVANPDIFSMVVSKYNGDAEFDQSDATAVKKIIDLSFMR